MGGRNNFLDLTGVRFGRLRAERLSGKRYRGYAIWVCRCDCGEEKEIASCYLRAGRTKSCGCLKKELSLSGGGDTATWYSKYGLTYRSWRGMIERCHGNKGGKNARNYRDRGIVVCKDWRDSFYKFYDDLGPRISRDFSIDRIDVNGNYEPGNCKWSTVGEQNENRRDTRIVIYKGIARKLVDICRENGIALELARSRLKIGWPVEDAVEWPKGRRSSERWAERGDPRGEKLSKGFLRVPCDASLLERVREAAVSDDRSVSVWVRRLVERELARLEAERG